MFKAVFQFLFLVFCAFVVVSCGKSDSSTAYDNPDRYMPVSTVGALWKR
jgi:hypothetical protein